MSSILKALKKLEQSKTLRRDSGHDMTWFVRGETVEAAHGRRLWPVALTLLGVAAAAVFATYLVMTRFAGPPRRATMPERITGGSVPAPPVASPPAAVPVAAAPRAKAAPAPSAPGPAAASEGLHVRAGNTRRNGQLPPGRVAARPKTGPEVVRGKRAQAVPARLDARPEASGGTTRPAPEPPAAAERPALRVGGIAWEKDNHNPMAIVNGTPVVEGATVGGARVEKIYQERVRFSYQGRSFDVGLGASSGGR